MTSLLAVLLKSFLIIKIRKLNVISESLLRFAHHYLVRIFFARKIVTIYCSVSFALPIILVEWYSSSTSFRGYLTYLNTWIPFNKIYKHFIYFAIHSAFAINTFTFSLIDTILLSFIYISYCRLTLKPMTVQIKKNLLNFRLTQYKNMPGYI